MLGAVCVWSFLPQALQECLGVKGVFGSWRMQWGYDSPQGWGSDWVIF